MKDTQLVRTCVDGDDHTLVLQRSSDDRSRFEPLFDLLPDDEPTDVLAITYRLSERFFDEWRERVDRRPRNVGVVSVGEQMRSTAADAPASVRRSPLSGVADPADADEIRRTTARYLDSWPDDGRAVVYFDSLTALFEYIDAEAILDFLESFRETLDARDAVGYFCMSPAVHGPRTVRTVASRFDTVVECVETDSGPTAGPPLDDCLDAMADARRRHLLAAVAHGEAVPVGELADYVAERTSADPETVRISLVNVHLPKLADLDIVAYDPDEGRVAPGVQFEGVVPFLRQSPDVDVAPAGR